MWQGIKIGDPDGYESIEWIRALQNRCQLKGAIQLHRYVFQRMDGGVGFAFQHGDFELFEEQALATDIGQRFVQNAVTPGRHRYQFDFHFGICGTQASRDMFSLPKRERALAGGEANFFHTEQFTGSGSRYLL